MKKKLIVLMAAMAVAVCMLFTGCGGNVEESPIVASETFTGVVSANSYSTKQEAVSDYVATEISGDDYAVVMTDYVKEADLTEKEIENLNIADEIDGTINSVEKVKVYFSEVPAARATASQSTEMCVTVYIIEFTPEGSSVSVYKYYIPLPANDEVLSYSYYNSVMNAENFKNCTATITTTTKVSVGGVTQNTSATQTMYITEDVVAMFMTLSQGGTSIDVSVYFVDSYNGVKCVMEAMGQCEVISMSQLGLSVNSISELYAANINEAQCSLFLKTDYGFKMRDEALTGVIDSTMSALSAQLQAYGLTWTTNKASGEYMVVEGKLYRATVEIDVDATYSSNSMSVYSNAEVIYTDYGKTTVTISDAAKNVLGIA